MGRQWPDLGVLALLIRKDYRLVGIHICPRSCQKVTEKPTQHSLLQQLLRKTLIDDIAMVIVKFRPSWPHTWRYDFRSLSRPTMTSGRVNGKCIAAVVDEHTREFKIPRQRRRQKRRLKSDFSIYETLARLTQFGHYVLCRRTLLELNS